MKKLISEFHFLHLYIILWLLYSTNKKSDYKYFFSDVNSCITFSEKHILFFSLQYDMIQSCGVIVTYYTLLMSANWNSQHIPVNLIIRDRMGPFYMHTESHAIFVTPWSSFLFPFQHALFWFVLIALRLMQTLLIKCTYFSNSKKGMITGYFFNAFLFYFHIADLL